jgi:mannose-6-phosphate isomerase-like protein (cupin superfamily)
MVIVYSDQVAGWVNPPPHERTLKVLLSPDSHPVTRGLGMGMVILPPGQTSSAHSHQAEQEVWYVISGKGSVRIGADQATVRPDTVVVAPPGVSHQLVNDGDEDLKAIWMFTPAGPEADYLPPEEGEEKSV